MLLIKLGHVFSERSTPWREKCLYDIYSGGFAGKGCSRFIAARCFFIFIYPSTETRTTKTTNPIQLPTINPKRRVRILARLPRSPTGPSPTTESGASRVLTSVHRLIDESTITGSAEPSITSSCDAFHCQEEIPSGIGLPQLPRPRTQIKYRVSEASLESLTERVFGSSNLPRT